jgi:cell division protein FtsQ
MAARAMTLVRRRAHFRHGWLHWVLVVCGAALSGLLVVHYAARPNGPAVKAVMIQVPANREVSAEQIRSAVASVVHGGLLTVNLGAVRTAVQQLPWIAAVSVHRVWPDTLAVAVHLRRPIARWGGDGLIDSTGHVFTPASVTAFATLPALDGPSGEASAVLVDYARVQRAVRPLGLTVTDLHENVRGGLRVTFASGLVLVLGHKNSFGRLARFIHIAVPVFGPRLDRVATVDMRYPNGFAVGWKGVGDHGSKK